MELPSDHLLATKKCPAEGNTIQVLNTLDMDSLQRKQASIIGALVADAASLGFHWLYDSHKIREIGGDNPEFHQPSASDYEDAAGYFAADNKSVGDQSHYGAQLLVALKSLYQCDGDWNPFHYQSTFCQAFDRGGSFSGYIDSATSGTLERVKTANETVLNEALGAAGELTNSQQGFFRKYVVKKGVLLRGGELEEAITGMAALVYKGDDILEKARIIVRHYDEHRTAKNGADDNQLPAAAKLPVVVARFAGQTNFEEKIEEAIRVTNDNDDAVLYGLFAAKVLEKVLHGTPVPQSLTASLELLKDKTAKERLEAALTYKVGDLHALGREFGPACPMISAIPVVTALLKDEPNFQKGVRDNILVSGDNAGRAIWLGAVLGAAYGLGGQSGVPLHWMAQVHGLPAVYEMIRVLE